MFGFILVPSRQLEAFERETVGAALEVEAHEVRSEGLAPWVDLGQVATSVIHARLKVGPDPAMSYGE